MSVARGASRSYGPGTDSEGIGSKRAADCREEEALEAASDAETTSTISGFFSSATKQLGADRVKKTLKSRLYWLWRPEPDKERSRLLQRVHELLESGLFSSFLILVIAVNICVMVMQANASHSGDPDLWNLSGPDGVALLEALNMVCLLIYVVEIIMRISVQRLSFFRSGWSTIDFIVVVAGVIDAVITSNEVVSLQGLRAFRVLRAGRALRLISLVPQLYLLIRGLPHALSAMFWGIVLALIMILVFSITAVELIHEPNQRANENDEFCALAFSSVQRAVMFFWITSVEGDGWGACLIPLILQNWYLWVFFAGVSMTLQLAILNVVLSVIVADSQSALEDDKEHRAKQVEDKKRSSLKSLKALLKKMDKNHDKQIAWNEFVEAWRTQPHFRSLMTILDVGEERLKEVFDMMDLDRSETINREEFLRFIQETHFCDMRMQITTMKMDLDHKWNLLLDLHDSVAVLAAEQRHTRASICSSQGMAEELPVVKAEPLAGVCSGAELRSVLSTALGAAFGGLEARLADRLEQLEAALAPPAAAPQADPSEGGSGGCAALGAALAGLEARLADRLEQLEAALARPAAPPLADALEGGAAGGGLVAEAPEKPRGGPLDAGPPAAVQVCPLQLPALPAAGAGQGDQSALAPAARAADRPAARGAAVGAGPVPAAEAQLPEASPAAGPRRAAAGAPPAPPPPPREPARGGFPGDPPAHGGREPGAARPAGRAGSREPPRRAPPGAAAEAARPRSASPRPGQAWAGAAGIGAPHETGGQDTPNAWHPQARSPSSPAAFDASFAWSPVPGGLNASGPWQRVSASMQASLLAAARQHAPVRAPLLPPLSLGPASASRVGVALQIAAGASAGESLPLQEVVRRMESAGIPLNAEEQQVLASSLAIGRGLC